MSESKHTPTPWEKRDGSLWGISPENKPIRLLRMTIGALDLEEELDFVHRAVNAHDALVDALDILLICAAPHLEGDNEGEMALADARAALAKARGEQP